MPLLPLQTALWLAGLLAGGQFDLGSWRTPVILVALCLATAVAVSRLLSRTPTAARRPAVLCVLAATFVAGGAMGKPPLQATDSLPAGMARIEAVVEEVRHETTTRATSRLRVLSGHRLSDGAPVAPGTLLRAKPHPMPRDARVTVAARLRPSAPFRNPTPHPRLAAARPVSAHAWIPDARAIQAVPGSSPSSAVDAARTGARRAIIESLEPRTAGVVRALVLGEGQAVDEDARGVVRTAGLAHVLAVSGLHVAIVAGLLFFLLTQLALAVGPLSRRLEARRVAAVLCIPAVLTFAAFAGGAPSAWRAATTAAIAWFLIAIGRRPTAVTVGAGAILLLTCAQPSDVTRPGLLLSVLATVGILTARLQPGRDLAGWLRAGWTLSWRTTVATAPVVLWCFGEVPIAGVVANLVVLPLASLLLVPGAVAHTLLACLSPSLAAGSAPLLEGTCGAFLAACETFARAGALRLPPPDVPQGLCLTACALALLWVRRRRSALLVLALTVVSVVAFEVRLRLVEQPTGALRVTFLDVGQGDSALLDLPDGSVMLIDAGGSPNGGPDPGARALVPLLSARRREHIDIVALSHPHPDHYGGLTAVLDAVSVGELWDSGQAEEERDMSATAAATAQLLVHARARGIPVRKPADLCGTPRRAGGATIRVLWPCPGYDSGFDANDNSLVLMIEHRGTRFLFTGDLETHGEQTLLARGVDLKADVLKVGHHGSRTSSTTAFLAAVAPKVAVVSSGRFNPYGHPHEEVRARLAETGAQVIELGAVGGTFVEARDGRLRVSR